MAKVRKTYGGNPDVVIVNGVPVHFDANGEAEVTDEAVLAVFRDVQKTTGQVVVEEDEPAKEELEKALDEEEGAKKRGGKKKAE